MIHLIAGKTLEENPKTHHKKRDKMPVCDSEVWPCFSRSAAYKFMHRNQPQKEPGPECSIRWNTTTDLRI